YYHDLARKQNPDNKQIDTYVKGAIKAIADAITNGEYQGDEIRIAYRHIQAFDDWKGGNAEAFLCDLLAKKEKVDPWLPNVLKGEAEIEAAWEARGSGWAYTVSKDAAKGFHEHLELAREALTAAWKKAPQRPEAAAAMIAVAMAEQENPN